MCLIPDMLICLHTALKHHIFFCFDRHIPVIPGDNLVCDLQLFYNNGSNVTKVFYVSFLTLLLSFFPLKLVKLIFKCH